MQEVSDEPWGVRADYGAGMYNHVHSAYAGHQALKVADANSVDAFGLPNIQTTQLIGVDQSARTWPIMPAAPVMRTVFTSGWSFPSVTMVCVYRAYCRIHTA